jgi:hypothetical protein
VISSLQPQSKRVLALFCVVFAILSGVAYLYLPWRKGVDFDVIGFFWLIVNIPKLAAAVTFWVSLVAAVVLWIDARLSG